ncbi:MAG: hypothetical protein F6K09_34125 [Merismopedia sp. SIO2A8]|nr:hypothetical protein [Symploca sp. SIO2B6]NET53512.1 hypothetical protein [Merismopedia sp. SIO2A8]
MLKVNPKILATLLPLIIVALFNLGCKAREISGNYPMDTLQSAPEQIEVQNTKLTLETYLWRDFMPISPPDGKPLIAVIRIKAQDSMEFPTSIISDKLWIINGQEIWETEFTNEEQIASNSTPSLLEKVARGGPKWESGVEVDVIIRIIDENNHTYLLKTSNQLINRTD